jgi:AraC family transcriptional regulator
MKPVIDEKLRIIHQVQDYIESNLSKALTVDELARVVHLSPFYFHRLFSYVTLETLHGYIKRNRLEKAAFLLLADSSKSITEIALDVGFANQSSFAKAFKLQYGISASQFRGERRSVEPYHRPSGQTPEMIAPLFIHIEEQQQKRLAYVRHTGSYKGNGELFRTLFGKLERWVHKNHINTENTSAYCLYHDQSDQTIDDRLRLSVCVDVESQVQASGEVNIMTLDGGKYATGRFVVSPQDFQGAWNYMLFQWLPDNGYLFDDRLPYERYSRDVTTPEQGKLVVDICIPVKK